MKHCEACGQPSPMELTSPLGTHPICVRCYENNAESPKQLAYIVRYCQRSKRPILGSVKSRIRMHAGDGLYVSLQDYFRRIQQQQLAIIEEKAEAEACEIILAKQREIIRRMEAPEITFDRIKAVTRSLQQHQVLLVTSSEKLLSKVCILFQK